MGTDGFKHCSTPKLGDMGIGGLIFPAPLLYPIRLVNFGVAQVALSSKTGRKVPSTVSWSAGLSFCASSGNILDTELHF